MIEFEGFELVHPEAGQLNRGLKTQPYIINNLMEAFGAKKPSTKTTTQNKLTSWQEESYQDSINQLGSGPSSSFTSYKPSEGPSWSPSGAGDGTVNYMGTWSGAEDYTPKTEYEAAENYQSIDGLNDLRSFKAKNTFDPSAQVNALMELGERGSVPYEQRLANVLEKANKDLTSADILNRRQGVMGGTTARNAALGAMGQRYAETVGRSAAAFAEESEAERMNRALRAFGMAGDIGLRGAGMDLQAQGLDLTARGQEAQYNLGRGDLEARQAMYGHGAAQSNLQFRQGLAQQDRQFAGNYGLQQADQNLRRYSTDASLWDSAQNRMSREGLARNQFGLDSWQMQEQARQRAAMMENEWNMGMENSRINRLRSLGGLATTPIFDTTITRDPGSPGLLPGLIGAAGTIGGAALGNPMAGSMIGNSVGNAFASGYGSGGGGTTTSGGGINPYMMMMQNQQGDTGGMNAWERFLLWKNGSVNGLDAQGRHAN